MFTDSLKQNGRLLVVSMRVSTQGGAFKGPRRAGLDHRFGKVPVQARTPAEGRFKRQRVDRHGTKVAPLPRGSVVHAGPAGIRIGTTVRRQAEKTDDLLAPRVEQR